MQTFMLLVRAGDAEKSFITGAKNYGEAVHVVEDFLGAGGQSGEILKVSRKSKLTFVPPPDGRVETLSEDLLEV